MCGGNRAALNVLGDFERSNDMTNCSNNDMSRLVSDLTNKNYRFYNQIQSNLGKKFSGDLDEN